jgi:SAM-dependent methyltransferase
MGGCCPGVCRAIEQEFGARVARRDALRYRRKGPAATTRLLRDGVTAAGGPGETLLDIGAGIGPLIFELLERGARRAVSVEASAACIAAGREEAARRPRAEQVEWHHGDYVALAGSLAWADTVALDRVVCCYPGFEQLLVAATRHARRYLAISYPRDVWYVRLALAAENGIRGLTGNAFRTFLHSPPQIDRLIRGSGFVPSVRRTTWVWCADVYVREASSARLR